MLPDSLLLSYIALVSGGLVYFYWQGKWIFLNTGKYEYFALYVISYFQFDVYIFIFYSYKIKRICGTDTKTQQQKSDSVRVQSGVLFSMMEIIRIKNDLASCNMTANGRLPYRILGSYFVAVCDLIDLFMICLVFLI